MDLLISFDKFREAHWIEIAIERDTMFWRDRMISNL